MKKKARESESERGDIQVKAQVRETWRWYAVGFEEERGAVNQGMRVAYRRQKAQGNGFPCRVSRSKAGLPAPRR